MALRTFVALVTSLTAQLRRQLSRPGGLGGNTLPPNWLGALAAVVLARMSVVVALAMRLARALVPVLRPIRFVVAVATRLARVVAPVVPPLRFALRTLAEIVTIITGILTLSAHIVGRAVRLVAARLPHPKRHVPRSEIEIAVFAGSISLGLLIGAAFAARELGGAPTSQVAAAPAPVFQMVEPTLIPTPTVKPLSDVPVRSGMLPRLKIPDLKVDAAMEPVGLTRGGAMGVPTDGQSVAWYSLGPFPGSPGNAVLAGHVDWSQRAAVFNRLKELAPGSRISLDFDPGVGAVSSSIAELDYRVTWVEQYRAQGAPLAKIFDNNAGSALTLITCGGRFDSATRTYLDRVVVRAVRA